MPAVRAIANSFDSYFREVNKTPLLNSAQERELSSRILDGDPAARDHMVRANLRLVVFVARQFLGRGLPLEELIQEGNLGLMRAVEAFDLTLDTRFSTYARYWIAQSIQRALDNMATSVRVPSYAVSLVANWRRTASQLTEELGRVPTEEEIAHRMDLSPRKLRIIRKALKIYNGAPHTDDHDNVSFNNVKDLSADDPSAALSRTDDIRQVLELLDRMEPRLANILRLRFGLSGEKPLTLAGIGERLGMTRERVRQLESEALDRLRSFLEENEAA